MKKKLISLLLSLCMVMSLASVPALAAEGDEPEPNTEDTSATISVRSQDDLVNAFKTIGESDDTDEWTISLTGDITLAGNSQTELQVGAGKTVTLLGNSHTITYNLSLIHI